MSSSWLSGAPSLLRSRTLPGRHAPLSAQATFYATPSRALLHDLLEDCRAAGGEVPASAKRRRDVVRPNCQCGEDNVRLLARRAHRGGTDGRGSILQYHVSERIPAVRTYHRR